jgi:hypothetical protein
MTDIVYVSLSYSFFLDNFLQLYLSIPDENKQMALEMYEYWFRVIISNRMTIMMIDSSFQHQSC